MSDPQDNSLPTSSNPTVEPADVASAQQAIDEVTATTTTTQPESIPDQNAPVMDSLPPTPPSPMPEPPVSPPPPVATTPMGDDTPLAFVAKPTMETKTEQAPPTTGADSLGSSYLPPTQPPTQPPTMPPVAPTNGLKKKTGSKIMMLVLGFVALLGVLGGVGYYGYQRYGTVDPITIASIATTSKEDCHGCVRGGWLVWRDGECKHTGICDSGVPGKDTDPPDNPGAPNYDRSKSDCEVPGSGHVWCQSVDSTGRAYAFCNTSKTKGCNNVAVEKGYSITYGASWRTGSDSTYRYKCTCSDAKTYYFDRPGVCDSKSVTYDETNGVYNPNFLNDKGVPTNLKGDGSTYDNTGLCAVTKTNRLTPDGTKLSDYNDCFTCTNNSCRITNTSGLCASCQVYKYTCRGSSTGNNSCYLNTGSYIANSEVIGSNVSAQNQCGTVEQIDVACGAVGYIQSRTIINGACAPGESPTPTPRPSPSPSPTPSPTPVASMMCTGLTRSPSGTVKIGDKLTLTCAGSVTPPTAGTLSYKFRYKIDNGAVTPLSNKTATTAELTIAACGTYTVECQACANLQGSTPTAQGSSQTCDPIWSGAQIQ